MGTYEYVSKSAIHEQRRYSSNNRLPRKAVCSVLGSVIPRARGNKHCSAALLACATSNCVLPGDITTGQIRRPKKITDPIRSPDFKTHSPADDETARWENTAAESPQAEAGHAKTRCSINGKTAL